jgi:hypothetical protein
MIAPAIQPLTSLTAASPTGQNDKTIQKTPTYCKDKAITFHRQLTFRNKINDAPAITSNGRYVINSCIY